MSSSSDRLLLMFSFMQQRTLMDVSGILPVLITAMSAVTLLKIKANIPLLDLYYTYVSSVADAPINDPF